MAWLMVFQKAFFCVRLKLACYIIAIIEMIFFISMGLQVVMLTVLDEESNMTDISGMVLATTLLLVRGLVCCCLFEGVRKNRRIYVTVYLCTSVCFFLVISITKFTDISSISSCIVFLVNFLPDMYFMMIVRSYWLVMETDPEPTEQTETAGSEQLTETSLDISVVH